MEKKDQKTKELLVGKSLKKRSKLGRSGLIHFDLGLNDLDLGLIHFDLDLNITRSGLNHFDQIWFQLF